MRKTIFKNVVRTIKHQVETVQTHHQRKIKKCTKINTEWCPRDKQRKRGEQNKRKKKVKYVTRA